MQQITSGKKTSYGELINKLRKVKVQMGGYLITLMNNPNKP